MHFVLNHQSLSWAQAHGFLLDLLRAHGLYSVKSVCREGDCGACQVLIGRKNPDGTIQYRTFNSCLVPVADIEGCHVITTEGVNVSATDGNDPVATELTPVQTALLEVDAIQCGYCTPGFVIALTGWLLNEANPTLENALDWLSGNLCRCTGYMGMRRAIAQLLAECPPLKENETPLQRAMRWGILPSRYIDIGEHLPISDAVTQLDASAHHFGGATDLAVEKPALWHDAMHAMQHYPATRGIEEKDHALWIGAGTDIETLRHSSLMRRHFPQLCDALIFFASRPIRHQATVGGNIAHASPSGDLTVMLLALDADVILKNSAGNQRRIAIKDYFIGYKKTVLQASEWIEHVVLPVVTPAQTLHFHFEKISKRIHQDIASTSVALALTLEDNLVVKAGMAAGGVAPIPLALSSQASFLIGKTLTPEHLARLAQQARDAIHPISDIRGSSDYKRIMVERLMLACAEAVLARCKEPA